MKTLYLTFVLLFTLGSCSDDDNTATPFVPVTINPVLIGKGYSFHDFTPGNLVISTQADWDAFLTSMGYVTDTFINTPVDFNLYEVIAILDSMRPDTGYSVNIDSVIENENNITVDFSVLISNDAFNAEAQPYHIVKIPISPKPVIFQ
jgi:hypothetical protein